ncbi:MAG: small ribosomal subunit Rsm22 family protein [Limisphaerales bacterium]
MKADPRDWDRLRRLRKAFLDGTAGEADYWRNADDLAAYDATFAQRIGWKWDFVLADLEGQGWKPPSGPLLDWGCGSGIASRAFLDRFPSAGVTAVHYWDRSPMAVDFASRRARDRFPGLPIVAGLPDASAIVLVSHVLTELAPTQVEALLSILTPATSVLWVEPGTYEASLALIAIRERMRHAFNPIAPCPHAGTCGVLQPGNESHWCHHFATPPPGVFTDPIWSRFSHTLGIDLRSIPLSYLVLDRRPRDPLPPGTARTIGRPSTNKVDTRYIVCTSGGVAEARLPRRDFPEVWRDAKKDRLPSLQTWERDDSGTPVGVGPAIPSRAPSASPNVSHDGT